MALKHGRNSVVMFNSTNLTGYLNSADASIEVENADTTTFDNSGYRSNIAGLYAATYSFEGFHDVAQLVPLANAIGVDSGVLSLAIAGGATIGDLVDMVSVTSTSLGRSSTLDGAVALSWAVASQKYVGFGQVLHPLAEDTNTTTGANKDDTAATSTGWTMQLHVTAVDAGSWVIKLVDAAASNFSDVADVTGGAFTAATGATSQRLESSLVTTTLRRYVRYVATRTGGSAGDGITFFLGYSRNRQ